MKCFFMTGKWFNEYSYLFDVQKIVELNQIKIGFNTVWTEHSNKILGIPSSVLVEGGLTKDNLSPIATLNPIQDTGYNYYSV